MATLRNGPIDHSPLELELHDAIETEIEVQTPEERNQFFKNLVRTSFINFAHLCMGLLLGSGGPSFLDILQITQTNVLQGSIYFTSQYLGILISGPPAGLLYDRYNAEPILLSSLMACGVLNVCIPYCTLIGLMTFVNILKGVAMGMVFIGVGSVTQRIWGKEKSAPYQQALHFAFSLGGVIAPLLMKPFLAPRINPVGEQGIVGNISQDIVSVNNTDYPSSPMYGESRIHSGFLIIGVITFLSGCSIIGLVIFDRQTQTDKVVESDKTKTESLELSKRNTRLTRRVRACFMTSISLYYILIVASETLFQNFLMTYVATHLKWEKSLGATLMMVYWVAFAVGRVSGVPVANISTPGKIISTSFCVMLTASVVFLFGAERHAQIVWFSSTVFSVFVASMFAAGVTYIDHYIMRVTGKVYGIIIMSATTGAMINPPILGALMTHFSPVWFSYLAVILCIFNLLNLAVLILMVTKWGRDGPTGTRPIEDHIFYIRCTGSVKQKEILSSNYTQNGHFIRHC